jgi:hypothetical protein
MLLQMKKLRGFAGTTKTVQTPTISYDKSEATSMPALDWSQSPAVESIPGKRSGAWVFRDTRTPV